MAGMMRSFDQYGNVMLEDTYERHVVGNVYADERVLHVCIDEWIYVHRFVDTYVAKYVILFHVIYIHTLLC